MKPMVVFPLHTQFWRARMESGQKTCISWYKRVGVASQCFMHYGKVYVILRVERRSLESVANTLYEQEGCISPQEFQESWVKLHGQRSWKLKEKVFAHHFMRLEEWG